MTSALAVSDLTFKNLLDELDLNPVWEKWRGYFFAVSIVCTLIPFYLTISGLNVHCVPQYDPQANDSASEKLSVSQTAYIDTVCALSEELIIPRYCGAFMLLMVVVLLLMSSYWLHSKDVADAFRTFNEAREKLDSLVLTREDMNKLCSNVLAASSEEHLEELKIIKSACILLSLLRRSNHVFVAYCTRSLLLFCSLCGCLAVSICFLKKLFRQSTKRFSCDLRHDRPILHFDNDLNYNFTCAANEAATLASLVAAFAGSLAIQTILLVHGMWTLFRFVKQYKVDPTVHITGKHKITKLNDAVSLMICFECSARPLKSGVLKASFQQIFIAQSNFILTTNLNKLFKDGSFDAVKNYVSIFGPIPETIGYIDDFLSKRIPYPDSDNSQEREPLVSTELDNQFTMKCIEFIKVSQCDVNDNRVISFVDTLRNCEHWELLVNLLENSHATKGTGDVWGNFDDLLSKKSKFGSKEYILCYAFMREHYDDRSVKFLAAKRLCKERKIIDLEKVMGCDARNEMINSIRRLYSSTTDIPDICREMKWEDEQEEFSTERVNQNRSE